EQELYTHTHGILERHGRASTTFDMEGIDGADLLSGMPPKWYMSLMDGNGAPASTLAKYLPEEALLTLWGKNTAEMRADGFRHYSIPGFIKRSDWMQDKRRGGTGMGDADDAENRDLPGDYEPTDLTDDELDAERVRAGDLNDEDRATEVALEQVLRDQDEDRDR